MKTAYAKTKNGIRLLVGSSTRRRPQTSKSRLKELFTKTKGKCWYCAVQMVWPASVNHTLADNECTLDHVHPYSEGGRKEAAVCHRCNKAKGNQSLDEFRDRLHIKWFYFELLGIKL